tara:strand:+ start:58 stop:648 length:591 start_codon:yes stop_codon:yes gene_type:complete
MSLGVILVSAEKVKAFTEVNENLDEALLLPNIQIAQNGLEYLLGTLFYDHLVLGAETGALDGAETLLMNEYIAPYLLWRATYEALPSIYMRMMNKSVSVGESPNSKAVSRNDMSYLREIQQSRYEWYSQRLQDFLQYRQAQYPLYFQYRAEGGIPRHSVNYFSGIVIPNGPRRGFNGRNLGLPVYSDPTNPNNCCW